MEIFLTIQLFAFLTFLGSYYWDVWHRQKIDEDERKITYLYCLSRRKESRLGMVLSVLICATGLLILIWNFPAL